MSSCGQSIDKIPFCPCLEANLSPIIGLRILRRRKEALQPLRPVLSRFSSKGDGPEVKVTPSTKAGSSSLYAVCCAGSCAAVD